MSSPIEGEGNSVPFCTECGIELEKMLNVCPLCHSPVQDSSESGLLPDQAYPIVRENSSADGEFFFRRRGFFTLIYSIVLSLTGIVCVVLDHLYSGGTWSAYVVLGLGFVWTLSFMGLYFFRSLLSMSMSMLLAIQAFLLGLDYMDGHLDWALSLALPLLAWVSAGIFVVWLSLHAFSNRLGFALSGFLGAVALVSMGTDLSIGVFQGHPRIGWSIVVLCALIPMAFVVLVLQWIWIKNLRFRRFLQW